ncbi:YbaL family putative K(+) efflux transporter [Demequina lignilytica]|uniref:YbaL family putative K(+) efflux transporter n=1 Tax=Demequina lignilytica TaxID=3051663 RepID=A0AB35MHF9_9MICO|nr:YbaL family putative K(+) efflux transporter [Demequina sp. SYSU T0a273]MDN4483150.1 YbaL family putative K(+) efflux transporter [Demequina sp. SYSU T0a273]
MLHHAPLITTIAVGLVGAFILGFIAQKLRLSPIVGYLAAGLLIGPHTPGYVGDVELATQLSEIGVILLMFGVGLHFSFRELLAVRKIALPGAIAQMTLATALGTGLGLWLGWGISGALLFGLALSVASTVVMLRALEERQMLDTRAGHIAVGWLIVEDLAMVIALVVVPVLAGTDGDLSLGALAGELAMTVLRVAAFVMLMLVVGRRVIPWALARVAHTGSRELFTLGVLAIGLGVAVGAAWLFEVSFALGAFFAGMILRESDLAHRAAEDSLPLRDAFAVLFFVAVGMLVDPAIVVEHPWALLATVAIIVAGKAVVAFALVRAMRYSRSMALMVAASLAQIGEFSFILVTLGADLEVMPQSAQDLVLAGAIISIVLNPVLFAWASRVYARANPEDADDAPIHAEATGHVIVVGYGRVGRRVARTLWERDVPVVVIDDDETRVEAIRELGHEAVLGNAARTKVLRAAGIADARAVVIGIPDPLNAGAVVAAARGLSLDVEIVARGHGSRDVGYLSAQGATEVLVGVHEVADLMAARY